MAKNPFLAAFLSLLYPSLGQIYAGKIMIGILLIIVAFIQLLPLQLIYAHAQKVVRIVSLNFCVIIWLIKVHFFKINPI